MTRFVSRVMVAVARMAVLGMIATLAGAQTHPATYPLNDGANSLSCSHL